MRELERGERVFFQRVLGALNVSPIDFLVGGGLALEQYTGIRRRTRDCDIFVRKADCKRVLDLFRGADYSCKLVFPHWLGKITYRGNTIDVIFNSGNGLTPVDDEWFLHAVGARVLDVPVKLVPPEEMIQSKAFTMERERFDGADVLHLIRSHGRILNWTRLVGRFGPHWRVLYSHILLYGFVYPAERSSIPPWVIMDFSRRLTMELLEPAEADSICNGTLLSRQQYLDDITVRGYKDGRRFDPPGISQEDIDRWTAAIHS